MRRRLVTIAAGVSVALCIGVCLLWVRSYNYSVYSRDGRVLVQRGDTAAMEDALSSADARPTETARPFVRAAMQDARFWATVRAAGTASSAWDWHGFERHEGVYVGVRYRLHAVPYYAIALPAVALAAGCVAAAARSAARRRRWLATRCCASCGYDLRATPDKCPECGTVPAAMAVAGAEKPA